MRDQPKPIPDGYHTAIPMLAVRDGIAALRFYQQVFDATEITRLVDAQGFISHAEIRIGAAQVMVADPAPSENTTPDELGGTPVIIHVFVADVDAVFERATAAGATILRPLANQFTGNRNGKFRDPFGHVWLVQTHIEDVSAEEMERRFAEMMSQNTAT